MNFNIITEPLYSHLQNILSSATSFQCAVAYLNSFGLQTIERDVEDILNRSGSIHFIHELEPSVTEPFTVRRLVKMKKQNDGMQYHVRIDQAINSSREDTERLFHPKIYLANCVQGISHCVIGSSNLTLGGLVKNYEINVLMSGDINEPELNQCFRAFKRIEDRADLITPNDEFCSIYDQLYEMYQSWGPKIKPDSDVRILIEKLRSINKYSWELCNQIDIVAVAIYELQNEGHENVHLKAIYERGNSLASEHGMKYDWKTWHNSVRGCINVNVNGKGKALFHRQDLEAKSGYYCLSDKGENYVLRRRIAR